MATTLAASAVDTAHVSNRRKVQFRSHDEVLADCERLAAGGYQQLGNWSLGKIASHLAAAMATALDGFPGRVSWPMRTVARLVFKNKAIAGPMRPGFKMPQKYAVVLMPDTANDAAGIDALRTVVRRWKNDPQRRPHGFFGKLTPEEWDKLMLNHSAMHMSFLLPK
ncbi:MAG TPA: DUF1569 domain-containing protein [Pirellulales bacterium]|jgi:hypothetical protein